MNEGEMKSRIMLLEQDITNLRHENTMLRGHLAMFTRRLADPEHDKRVTERRKLAFNVVNERRRGIDRRQHLSGPSGSY